MVRFLNEVAYVLGPIHFAFSLPIYILFTVANGFFFNWFSLLCYVVIVANGYFYYWYYNRYKEKYNGEILKMIEGMESNWTVVTVVPNAFIILFLGIIQLDQFGV